MKDFLKKVLDNNLTIGIFGAGLSGKAASNVLCALSKRHIIFDENTSFGENFLLSCSKKKFNS